MDSFSDGLLEHPQYTRPAEFRGHSVPPVLLEGHHQRVAGWRREQKLQRTAERRPDLLRGRPLSAAYWATLKVAARGRVLVGGEVERELWRKLAPAFDLEGVEFLVDQPSVGELEPLFRLGEEDEACEPAPSFVGGAFTLAVGPGARALGGRVLARPGRGRLDPWLETALLLDRFKGDGP